MAKPVIDKDCCTHCGVCVSLADQVFEFNEDGEVDVIQMDSYDDHLDEIEQAKDSCPDDCISIVED